MLETPEKLTFGPEVLRSQYTDSCHWEARSDTCMELKADAQVFLGGEAGNEEAERLLRLLGMS